MGWVLVALIVGVNNYERHVLVEKGSFKEVWDWVQASNAAKDLIDLLRRMTDPDPDKRPHLYEIYKHRAVQEAIGELGEVSVYHSSVVQMDISLLVSIGKGMDKDREAMEELSTENRRLNAELLLLKKGTLPGEFDVAPTVSSDSGDISEEAQENATVDWKILFHALPEYLKNGKFEKHPPKWASLESIALPNADEKCALLSDQQIILFIAVKALSVAAKGKEFQVPGSYPGRTRADYFTAHLIQMACNLHRKTLSDTFFNLKKKHEDVSKRFGESGGFNNVKSSLVLVVDRLLSHIYRQVKSRGRIESRAEMETLVVEAFTHGIGPEVALDYWGDWAKAISLRLWEIYQL